MEKVQNVMQILYWDWKAKNTPKLISMHFKDNMQNQTVSELYADDNKTKYSSNPNDILKSVENFYEKVYTKRQRPKLLILNFLAKFITERKSQMNNLTFVRLTFLSNFKKLSLNEHLPPILLNVFYSWDKFDTMGVSSRTRVIAVIY